jgi:hypothetical protein
MNDAFWVGRLDNNGSPVHAEPFSSLAEAAQTVPAGEVGYWLLHLTAQGGVALVDHETIKEFRRTP